MVIDYPILIALMLTCFGCGWLFGWLSTRSEIAALKADKQQLRERCSEQLRKDVADIAKAERVAIESRHATEIEAAELMRQLKAATIVKDGLKKAVKKQNAS